MLLRRSALPTAIALAALTAACDSAPAPDDPGQNALDSALPPRASGAVSVVETFADLGGKALDVALLPAPEETPWAGRGVVLLDSGDIALIDFSFGEFFLATGAPATTLEVAPDFQMRGVDAPLILAAGGEEGDGVAFIYLAEDELLLEAPLDPIAPGMAVLGLCPVRANASRLDVVAVGGDVADTWRIIDRGEESLAAERFGDAPDDAAVCIDRLRRGAAGLTINEGSASEDISDSTAAVVEGAALRIDALPAEGVLHVHAPGYADPVLLRLEGALNTGAADQPVRVAASGANFGGSYGGGVVLVATQDGDVSVLALDDVADEAQRARLAAQGRSLPLDQATPPG